MKALSLLATGLTGTDVQVQLDGDRPGVILTDGALFLPTSVASQASPVRAAVAHAVAHLLYSATRRPVDGLRPLSVAMVSAFEDVRVERLLARRFPAVKQWFLNALPGRPDAADLSFPALLTRMDLLLADPTRQDDNYWVNKARRLFEETVESAGLDDYDAFRAAAGILANDLGQMRVRFEPQQYVVPANYRDDNSYLWDFSGAKQPPAEEMLLHQQQLAHKAESPKAQDEESPVDASQPEPVFIYPEWDYRLERLRTDWCTVVEKLPQAHSLRLSVADAKPHTPSLALKHVRRISRTRRLRRQWEGEDIDLNAAIESALDQRLGLRPEPRMFMRSGKEPGASSILVLLDLSASSNDSHRGNAMSLLDFEKQAALMLTAAAMRPADRIAVHGFSSNTRAEVSYTRLFEFGESASSESRARIASAKAMHSTRMGAALRHATAQLRMEPAFRRAILLVTDGVPADIDVHDPAYLVEDARAAVLDANREGVRSYCIAVDEAGDEYARRIFGWHNYSVTTEPGRLPVRLKKAYARLVAN